MTRISIAIATLLLSLVALTQAVEWYEQGHQNYLTWQNFDMAVSEPGKYKFVKFFTRNCRYCRFLKTVEEQLRAEKQWGFRFYDVDCSVHYDLCNAKASMTSFPYVGVYNTSGDLEGHIGGYYPIDTMREAFNVIEKRQIDALALQTPTTPIKPSVKTQTSAIQHPPVAAVADKLEQKEQIKMEIKTEVKVQKEQQIKIVEKKDQGYSKSIGEGIKMCVILLGVWIYNKTITPYYSSSNEDDYSQARVLQIPISPSKVASESAKDVRSDHFQSHPLLADTL